MKGLAAFRIALGTASWVAPRFISKLFGVPEKRITPELEYMNRVFGVRAVTLGVGYLASSPEGRPLWHRLWLLCDTADTVMGIAMVKRRRLGLVTGGAGVATTGVAAAIDLAALGR
jgi:hypothetical protein